MTALLLLERLTLRPLAGAAEFRLTVQASDPAPANELWLHERPLNAADEAPVPLSGIFSVLLLQEELEIVRVPDAAPAAVGTSATVNVTLFPGANVSGAVSPVILKPVPAMLAERIVTD